MASGWANDDAVNEQINSTIEDAIARARGEIPRGESLDECEECGAPIPQARREAIPGVRLCIHCQQEKDLQKPAYTGYNRRGSKDGAADDFLDCFIMPARIVGGTFQG
ncbi:DksA-type zinc finger protein [Escherichia coli]|nr:DksA-type zinc finger protein [Escherichia coli]